MLRLGALVALLFLAGAAVASAAAPVESFVTGVDTRLDELRATEPGARADGCGQLLDDAFDETAIVPAVAAGHWGSLGQFRDDFAAAVGARLLRACLDVLVRDDEGDGTVRRVRERDGYQRVTVQYGTAENPGTVLVWTLQPGGPLGWQAVDLTVEGRGLVAELRADFEAALGARGSVPAAIADLAGKK